nr:putative transposase En/Spm [Ipomoea batatas]
MADNGESRPNTRRREKQPETGDDLMWYWTLSLTSAYMAMLPQTLTQTDASDTALWLEATSGVKRGGYVYGFGSDTLHCFLEASKKSKSQAGASSSNAALMTEIQEMREEIKQNVSRRKQVYPRRTCKDGCYICTTQCKSNS